MQKPVGILASGKSSVKVEKFTEYKLRVPRKLVKRYNVMKINAPRPVKLGDIKEASMVRKSKKQAFVEDDAPTMPTFGAGSVYNYERKEEARRKRRGYTIKEINKEDLPYALRLGGKGGKRYTGSKEPILEHSAYYILTQCPDGVFEAVPVQAWYNFMPDIDYTTLSADEVEHEFSKRDRTLSYFTKKYQLGNVEEEGDEKVKRKDDDHGLIIHDDDIDNDGPEDFEDEESDEEKNNKKSTKKDKNIFHGKRKKKDGNQSDEVDSDQEEEFENLESKEVDYMSESSSEDELLQMDDEPDPEKDNIAKAKDELNNIFSDSEEDEDGEEHLNDAGKELKAMLKKESGVDSSEEEEEDEDIDNEYSKSAVFMQEKDGRKKKLKSGSNSGSKPSSRSSTPVPTDQPSSETLLQAIKSLKDGKSSKRSCDTSSPSSQSKKQKLGSIVTGVKQTGSPLTIEASRSGSPAIHSGTPSTRSGTLSDGSTAITEDTIRRYLTHKPMTTTDLVRKFKTKKTGLTKEQTVSMIAAILKKIQPDHEKVDGKLYLSIKTRK